MPSIQDGTHLAVLKEMFLDFFIKRVQGSIIMRRKRLWQLGVALGLILPVQLLSTADKIIAISADNAFCPICELIVVRSFQSGRAEQRFSGGNGSVVARIRLAKGEVVDLFASCPGGHRVKIASLDVRAQSHEIDMERHCQQY